MCGLVGMVLKTQSGGTTTDANLFEQLLYIDALRGDDSTGVAALYNDGSIKALKEACPADMFRNTKEWNLFFQSIVSKGKAIIGHNRKKTIGTVSDETAHPFVIDNRYVFMHNGTLFSHKHLADTEVDSEALGIHLTKCEGDVKQIEEALSKVYGAYAVAWIDQEKECLYLLRNKDRPLHLAKTPWGYIFCSEPGFIAAAAMRNSTKLDWIKEIEVDTLYTIDCTNVDINMTEQKLTLKKAMLPHTPTVGAHTTQFGGIEKIGGSVSKNALKRFRKNLIGRRLLFWSTDYVQRHVNEDNPKDWIVWGENEILAPEHVVQGTIFNMDKQDMFELTSGPLSGRVTDVHLSEQTNGYVVWVDQIIPVMKSLQNENTVAVH